MGLAVSPPSIAPARVVATGGKETAGNLVTRARPSKNARRGPAAAHGPNQGRLQIIGGSFRGRKLSYCRWAGTRPMKQRVRAATFNLLGPAVTGKHAIDLFAGSGALGLEAISRGAASATFIERHVPTAALIRQNIAALGVEDRTEVLTVSAFVWAERPKRLPQAAWVVFCSPPYDYYGERREAMLRLIEGITNDAPEGSILVVEADDRLDFASVPDAAAWDVRSYRPARLGIRTIRPGGR